MDTPIAVSCQLNVKDLYLYSLTTLRRRFRWFLWLMSFLILFLVYNIVVNHISWGPQAFVAFLFFFLFMPYSFFVSPYISARKRIRTDAHLSSPTLYTFSPSNVTMQSNSGDANLNWSAFTEALETRRHFFLYQQALLAYILPKRCFASPTDVDLTRQLIRDHIAKSKLYS